MTNYDFFISIVDKSVMNTITKKTKAKSDVWNYFIKESSTSARCILCTKVLKHKGNTTNLHNHYKNVHRMIAETESMGPTLPKRSNMMSTEDAENTTKENELNKGTSISSSTLKIPGRRMPLMDNSSDSNIDEQICQKDTDTECQSDFFDTTSHSRQSSKFKDKCQVKNLIYSLINIDIFIFRILLQSD